MIILYIEDPWRSRYIRCLLCYFPRLVKATLGGNEAKHTVYNVCITFVYLNNLYNLYNLYSECKAPRLRNQKPQISWLSQFWTCNTYLQSLRCLFSCFCYLLIILLPTMIPPDSPHVLDVSRSLVWFTGPKRAGPVKAIYFSMLGMFLPQTSSNAV